MDKSIFKAYDIRGVYPEEINKEAAFKIGLGLAKFFRSKDPDKKMNLVVGEDCRIASPTLRGAVVDALTKPGINVYYVGQCTTPLFYYSVNQLKADGGVMVTASHNPPQYGGLKIVGEQSRPIGSETGLQDIYKFSEEDIYTANKEGTVEEKDLVGDYVNFVFKISKVNPLKLKKLKVVIDAGNGMTPIVLKPLLEKLGSNFTRLYFGIDCKFPNHTPDISRDEALDDLRRQVIESRADVGVAFDGDGDRVAFMDKTGNKIDSGYILALLFNFGGGFFGKPKTIYDLRFSRSVREILGGRGIKSRVGHSFIKDIMRKNNADLGGELSGHFFFKEMGSVESSVLVMLKILKILAESGKTFDELVKPLQKYWHSGEVNIDLEQGTLNKAEILQKLEERYKDGKIDKLDGVTVDMWDSLPPAGGWWFNVRPSNTEPIMRVVVEAETKEIMESKITQLKKFIISGF